MTYLVTVIRTPVHTPFQAFAFGLVSTDMVQCLRDVARRLELNTWNDAIGVIIHETSVQIPIPLQPASE